jgi:hypothetical protein
MSISGNTHATSVARLGVMRLGASRLNYFQPWVRVVINGTNRTALVRVSGITIQQLLDGTPDTAHFRVDGFTPVQGQDVKIYLGDSDLQHLLFAGHILSVKSAYEDIPDNLIYDVSCIDYTWRLNSRKIIRRWTSTSATTIIRDIMTTYTSGFTTVHVTAGLDALDEFTCTNEDVTDALDRIADRLGGYWYVDAAKDLHFFLTDETQTTPVSDTMQMGVEDVNVSVDLSQTRTRIWSRGGGSQAAIETPANATTLPVNDGTWYSANGGYVESGAQRISYTGKSAGDGGSTSLPPAVTAVPTVPAAARANNGVESTYVSGNLLEGVFKYRVTYVVDGPETAASPAATVTIPTVAAPLTHVAESFATSNTGGALNNGMVYRYKVSYLTADGETLASSDEPNPDIYGGNYGAIALTVFGNAVSLGNLPTSPDGRVTGRVIYRTEAFVEGVFRKVATINDNITSSYKDTMSDATLSVQPVEPSAAAVQSGKVGLSGISTGPSGTSARKIYRTARNGTTFKLLTTLADNTTTTYLDNTVDGSLGANLTTTDSVGASIGDASLTLVDLSQIPASGWLRVGRNLIRYTARSNTAGAGTVSGIPTSGFGSITVNIPPGEAVVAAPHLTGVSGILYTIPVGDDVNVLTMNEDANAQSTLATTLASGDGIVEGFIADGRLSLKETDAYGAAKLAEVKDPLTTVTLTTRDQTFQSGRSTTFSLSAPSITGTYRIQSVTITNLGEGGPTSMVFPMRQVQLSSRRFSFEGLLRQLQAK